MFKNIIAPALLPFVIFFLGNSIRSMEKIPENKTLDSINVWEKLPYELWFEILSHLIPEPKSNYLLDHAQMLFERTEGLRLSNKFFSQTIENIIANMCLGKFENEDIKAEWYTVHSNASNIFGLVLFFSLFLDDELAERDLNYKTLKTAFLKKIVFINNKGGFGYHFSKSTDEELIEILSTWHGILNNIKHHSDALYYSDITLPNLFNDALNQLIEDKRKPVIKATICFIIPCNINFREAMKKITNNEVLYHKHLDTTLCYEHFRQLLMTAILFDHHQALCSLLQFLTSITKTDEERSNYVDPIRAVSFASSSGSLRILRTLMNYYENHTGEYTLNIENRYVNPLQRAFDAGNEQNFILLMHYGADLELLDVETPIGNQHSPFFRALVKYPAARTIGNIEFDKRKKLEKLRTGKKRLQRQANHLRRAIKENNKHRVYVNKILAVLGTGLLGFIAYQFFKKSPNYSKIYKATGLKNTIHEQLLKKPLFASGLGKNFF